MEYLVSNKIKYNVLSIEVRNFTELKHGLISRILNKEKLPESQVMSYTEYILKVRSPFENFNRKFFLSEKEFSEL